MEERLDANSMELNVNDGGSGVEAAAEKDNNSSKVSDEGGVICSFCGKKEKKPESEDSNDIDLNVLPAEDRECVCTDREALAASALCELREQDTEMTLEKSGNDDELNETDYSEFEAESGSDDEELDYKGLPEDVIMLYMKSEKYIAGHPTSSESAELCSICWVEFKNNDEIGRIECSHKHHFDCLKKWLMKNNICPVCKGPGVENLG